MNDSQKNQKAYFEYEERSLLEEDQFIKIKTKLDSIAKHIDLDNKKSYFFVLPDVNISIATSHQKTVLKYKGGQLGKGNRFEEYEISIHPDSLKSAISFLTSFLKIQPMVSEQFRLNYNLGDGIEVALKYTQTWGFHIEVEKVYSIEDSNFDETKTAKAQARRDLEILAQQLGIVYMTDNEIEDFVAMCKAGTQRGSYTPDEFREKYGQLFS